MIKKNLPTLKIHKLKRDQYNEIKSANAISDNEIYEITDAAIITETEKTGYDTHIANSDIHVTVDEKAVWNENEVFLVTITFSEDSSGIPQYTSDKTFSEIQTAVASGKCVYCFYEMNNSLVPYLHTYQKDIGSTEYLVFFYASSYLYCRITISDQNAITVYFGFDNYHLPESGMTKSGKILMVNSFGEPEWTSVVKPTITTTTLLALNWDSTAKTYSFESTYPSASYDIEVEIDGDNCTDEQLEAWIAAKPLASSTNKINAKGDVPSIDIPIILTVTPK